MTSDIVLTAAMRNNLLSLQGTQSSIDTIQNRLATGLKVSSALDNPQNFFASENLKNRAGDLTRLLDSMGQSIQTIKSADNGVTGMKTLIDQAESIIESASEAITSGEVEASITGNVNLKGVEDLTDYAGISAGDDIVFTYSDPSTPATTTTATISISANDSIDELITKINDIEDGGVFKAELNSEGYLKITELQGKAFNMAFEETAPDDTLEVGDLAIATTLGFGNIVEAAESGSAGTEGQYEVTVLANTKLVSGNFYTTTSGSYADASALLTSVRTTDGGATARFDEGDAGATTLEFTINGETTIDIAIDGMSIQGLVDSINNHTSNTDLVEAAYDPATGQFTIEATSEEVNSVSVTLDDADAASGSVANFGFGLVDMTVGADANDRVGETFRFARASETLARLADDYNTLRTQIDELAADSGYRGVNLLAGDSLVTYFDEDRESKLSITGSDLSASGMEISEANFNTLTNINGARTEILAAKETVRNFGSTLANGLSVVQTREVFTQSMVNTLTEGSDKLTVADQNEEGAKLLALQTRQQLGTISLSMASQAQQSVLRLF